MIRRKSPAVTRVLLWTRALIGVGAAIAFVSQAEKGNCADLVIAVRRRMRIRNVGTVNRE